MTEAIFTPDESKLNQEDEELGKYFSLLPEKSENETDEEYVERIVDIERGIEKKPAYTKEEVVLKDAVRMYLYHEMKLDDRKMGELVGVEPVTICSWRYKHGLEVNSDRKKPKKRKSLNRDYPKTEREKQIIAEFFLMFEALVDGKRGENVSLEKVRKRINQPEL